MDLQRVSGVQSPDDDENNEEATNMDHMCRILRGQLNLLEWMDNQSGISLFKFIILKLQRSFRPKRKKWLLNF